MSIAAVVIDGAARSIFGSILHVIIDRRVRRHAPISITVAASATGRRLVGGRGEGEGGSGCVGERCVTLAPIRVFIIALLRAIRAIGCLSFSGLLILSLTTPR
jgi:hypothetical protein